MSYSVGQHLPRSYTPRYFSGLTLPHRAEFCLMTLPGLERLSLRMHSLPVVAKMANKYVGPSVCYTFVIPANIRQLCLLFEEARNSQPSIIFSDEINGLAPVHSSKQDQIHASIMLTFLGLMDGMDGRAQVVVIGATNRLDVVDPALRRPGRFHHEFTLGYPRLKQE